MVRAQANWIIFVKGIKGSRFPTGIQLIFLLPGEKKKKFALWSEGIQAESQRAVTAAATAGTEDFLVPMPC